MAKYIHIVPDYAYGFKYLAGKSNLCIHVAKNTTILTLT